MSYLSGKTLTCGFALAISEAFSNPINIVGDGESVFPWPSASNFVASIINDRIYIKNASEATYTFPAANRYFLFRDAFSVADDFTTVGITPGNNGVPLFDGSRVTVQSNLIAFNVKGMSFTWNCGIYVDLVFGVQQFWKNHVLATET